MQIFGPFRVSTTQPANPSSRLQPAAVNSSPAATRSSSPVDSLELSGQVNRMDSTSAIAGGGEIRIDRVADLRRQIASGSYDTPEKLDLALSRMLDDFA